MPEFAVINEATKLAIVDFPEPEVPTKAVTDPFGARKLISCTTSDPFS